MRCKQPRVLLVVRYPVVAVPGSRKGVCACCCMYLWEEEAAACKHLLAGACLL
jgi:hypothetical protein